VADEYVRLNVTLPAEHGEKLNRLAERTHVPEGTLASSLLAKAIEEADPDPESVLDLLDSVPGAWKRIDAGIDDAHAGRTIPFGEQR
jgi:predicted transcriptional regulator